MTFILDAHFIANSSEAAIFKSPFPNPLKTDQRDQRKPKLTDGAEESECEQVEESSVHLDLGWRNLQRRHMSPLEGPAGVCTYNHPPPWGGAVELPPPGIPAGREVNGGKHNRAGICGFESMEGSGNVDFNFGSFFLAETFCNLHPDLRPT